MTKTPTGSRVIASALRRFAPRRIGTYSSAPAAGGAPLRVAVACADADARGCVEAAALQIGAGVTDDPPMDWGRVAPDEVVLELPSAGRERLAGAADGLQIAIVGDGIPAGSPGDVIIAVHATLTNSDKREFIVPRADGGELTLAAGEPLIMGVVNVTPDSFSDGGRFDAPGRAIDHGLQLAREGATIVDIGGESTRPGARPVTPDEELRRVVPVIEGIRANNVDVAISIDTSKAVVAAAALDAGASIVNDVTGADPDSDLGRVLVARRAPVIAMHMQGEPRSMQTDPNYTDVVADIFRFFVDRIAALIEAGLPADRIIIDPGFGFGKTQAHNLALLRSLGDFTSLGRPILAGMSRKSMLGRITGAAIEDRLPESLAVHILAAARGAHILRVHDVREMYKALTAFNAAR
jgi:dihydropteroate synthase